MSSVDKIKWAMSLRDPQYEALQYFDAISSKIEYRTSSKAEAEKIASENCQAPHTISVDKEFDFPSFCFDMTTGIGKSRLMGASDVKKSLVSSANLSYHGMQGNIEMGFLIESHDKAKQIEEVMKEMVRMKVCGKYK